MMNSGKETSDTDSTLQDLVRERARAREYLDIAGVVIVALDAAGRITLINRKGCDLLGGTQEEIVGKNWFDRFIPERERESLHAGFNMLIDGQVDAMERYENPVVTLDGEERLLAWHNTLLRDDDGTITGTLSSGEDITERKIAEKRIRASEERYRDLVERAGVAILIDDRAGRLIYFNRQLAEMYGFEASDLEGGTLENLVHPDDRERVLGMHADRMIGKETPQRYEFRGVHSSGSTLDIEIDVTPLLSGGKAVGSRSFLRDVTEKKNLERQLLQAQKLEGIGMLAGGVAHDFNNLLLAVFGHVDLAMIEIDEEHPLRDHLVQIRSAADRAADLTRQLLAFSQRQRLEPKDLDFNDLVTGFLKFLRRIIGEDIELRFTPGSDLAMVRADPAQMEQVFMNLVVNARDAMPDGGVLTIATGNLTEPSAESENERRTVCMTVADTGCGMDQETAGRIFEPFFTTKEPGKGTGLGLATVYGIVKQHGGRIEVESAPGEGTRFQVFMPALGRIVGEEIEVAAAPAPGGTETILVAEDDPMVREVVVGALENAGYGVVLADDGEEALEKFRVDPGRIDAALLDVVMPRLGGRETHKAMSEIRAGVPVLFSSGYSAEWLSRDDPDPESFNLIQKPYSTDDLLHRLREILDA